MKKMSMETRREVVERARRRYRRAGRRYRRVLIEELRRVCGYERKYAIKVLTGNRPGPGARPHRGRGRVYGAEEEKILQELWRRSDYPCGKRLVTVVELWLPAYERRYGAVEESVKRRLKRMSPATMDRRSAPWRCRLKKRRGGTKPGSLLRSQIPVRCGTWDIDRPGYLEADSVDHGGETTEGSYLHSLTFTDIHSGWTEQAAIWNKGAAAVLDRLREIEQQLPFPLLGFDSDNGGEFLNHHLYRYLGGRTLPVGFTRSRSYHQNDNAHVEQKNWSKVRLLLGYERYDNPELVPVVHGLYRGPWRLLQNLFQPVMKLRRKVRSGARVRKCHDRPQTPAQRLLAWPELADDQRQLLQNLMDTLDPLALVDQVDAQLRSIRTLLRQARRHVA
jgi:hypothetical protein